MIFLRKCVILSSMKWQIYHFDEVSSTNELAHSYPVYTVVVADHQTAGRGRHGRIWESVNGNLYGSLVLPDFNEKNPYLAFIVGVAVASALAEFDVRLKWPNDVLLDGKKIGGILLEQASGKLIAGIGINLVGHPTGQMAYPVGDLGGRVSKLQLIQRILNEMDAYLKLFKEKGFAGIREKWLTLSYLQTGDNMSVRLPHQTYTGKLNGIDENGLLLLELEDRTILKISAGDVFKI